jgi:hypothetical protein
MVLELNPRIRNQLQKVIAILLYLLGLLVVIVAFVPIQYPDWWPKVGIVLPSVPVPWWPVVHGIGAGSHYSARIFLTLAFGLTIFLPQVETTFVSLMRRKSSIGAPYVDRRDFACPVCGTFNRPGVQFCVKCGVQVYSGTRHWGRPGQSTRLVSFLRITLEVSAVLALFIGFFDLTIYSTITAYLGTDSVTVFVATVLSSIPSIAGYVALKEGPFRKYSSLKQFDKLVFGDWIWIAFALLFILMASFTLLATISDLLGSFIVLVMQLVLAMLLIMHPFLRRRVSRPVTIAYA